MSDYRHIIEFLIRVNTFRLEIMSLKRKSYFGSPADKKNAKTHDVQRQIIMLSPALERAAVEVKQLRKEWIASKRDVAKLRRVIHSKQKDLEKEEATLAKHQELVDEKTRELAEMESERTKLFAMLTFTASTVSQSEEPQEDGEKETRYVSMSAHVILLLLHIKLQLVSM